MKRKSIAVLAVAALVAAACGSDDAADPPEEGVAQATVIQTPVDTPTPILSSADLVAPTPSGRNLQPNLADANIDLEKVVALLPPDAIPAILPERAGQIMVTAEEAELAGIAPDVQVIGVSIEGESHAYPIPFLSRHEIVNAEIGGRKLAVTW